MKFVALAAGLVAVVVSGLRWVRVAQREHYIPGSVATTARRWVTSEWLNMLFPLIAVATAVIALVADGQPGWAFPAAAAVAGFPVGMTVLGTDVKLKFTRRATTLAVVCGVFAMAVCVLVGLVRSWWIGPAVAAVLMIFLVDLALLITRPWEARSARRFQQAAEKRLRAVAPKVIAVTGSYGKTSTKNHIRDLASGSIAVVASPASFNNLGGLSRTMNEHLVDGTDLLVAEMGMYGPGEIRGLCSWVRPHIGVITAIGPMHLERVGSIDGIVAAKAEILEGASIGVLWVDDPRLAELANRTSIELWRAGTHGSRALAGHTNAVSVEERPNDGVWVARHDGTELGEFPATLHPGNVACAVAAVLAAGVPAPALRERLARLVAPAHRATVAVADNGIHIIDDTYNANPAGAAAAVRRLAGLTDGQRVVVTPGLVELGSEQRLANRMLGEQVAESGATLLVVGRTNRAALVSGARSRRGQVVTVSRRNQARDWIRTHLIAGDAVLWENDLPDHYP